MNAAGGSNERWTVLLLAGARPGGDALTASLGVDYKPVLPILGEAMVRRPIRALLEVGAIARIRVLTQQPERLAAVIQQDARITVEPSNETMSRLVGTKTRCSIWAFSAMGAPCCEGAAFLSRG